MTVRRLLEQCPGESLCDACLAFACSVSLTEMRLVTAAVGHDAPFRRDSAICASCRRQTTTLAWGTGDVLATDKCSLCREPIDPAEAVEVVNADRFHSRCWQRLTTEETRADATTLGPRSIELIRKSRELLGLRPLEGSPGA